MNRQRMKEIEANYWKSWGVRLVSQAITIGIVFISQYFLTRVVHMHADFSIIKNKAIEEYF